MKPVSSLRFFIFYFCTFNSTIISSGLPVKRSFLILLLISLFGPIIAAGSPDTLSPTYRHQVVRIDSMAALIEDYRDRDIDSCLLISQEVLRLSLAINYIDGRIKGMQGIVICHIAKREYAKAIGLLYEKLKLHIESSHYHGLIETHCNLIYLFIQVNDTSRVMNYYNAGYALAEKTQNPADMGSIINARALYSMNRKEYIQAQQDAIVSLNYYIKAGDERGQGINLRLLGDIYLQTGDFQQALRFYNKALEQFIQINKLGIAGTVLTRIAHVYDTLHDYPKALDYNLQAYRLRKVLKADNLTYQSMVNIGAIYLKMNIVDSGLYYLKTGLSLLDKGSSTQLSLYGHKKLTEYYESVGDHRQALVSLEQYHYFKSKLTKENNNLNIKMLNARWMINEKEYFNMLLQQENKWRDIQFRRNAINIITLEVIFLALFFAIVMINSGIQWSQRRKTVLEKLNETLKNEILEKQEAEIVLHRNEEKHRFLADNLIDVIFVLDDKLVPKYVSPSSKRIFGFEPWEMVGRDPKTVVFPEFHATLMTGFEEMIRTRKATRLVYKSWRKDGSFFWAENIINPFFDPETGLLKEAIGVVRDVTELKKHEEFLSDHDKQRSLLLHEIHNRVKNNFAILISFMDMQQKLLHDKQREIAFKELKLRIRTMSLVHEMLYREIGIHTVPLGDYLNNLVMIIASAYKNPAITVKTDIDPCMIKIEKALPIGLIVNELVTNAYKYAFPDYRQGTIHISLKPEGADEWAVTVADDGVGIPDGFSFANAPSMGSQIVSILIRQVYARLEITNHSGTHFKLTIPINSL